MKVFRFISTVIIVVVLILGFVFVFNFTAKFSEPFKTFYVNVNGKNVFSQENEISVSEGEDLTVKAKYTFGIFNSDLKGYDVKIKSRGEFGYSVDGKNVFLSDNVDLTEFFDVQRDDDGFQIHFEKLNMLNILMEMNEGKSVCVGEDLLNTSFPVCLVVSSKDGSLLYNFKFGLKLLIEVDSVSLSVTEMVF